MVAQMKKTILLVEDEAIIAMAEAMIIRRFGYDIIIAKNGEDAVSRATSNAGIDLILMDIDLGQGIDGTEAARRILESRDLPIVFLTSHSEREMVERVRGITRYGYVIKNSGDFVLQSSIEMAFELFEAREKANASEAFQKTLVRSIPDLVWLKDVNGVYLSCNPRFEQFFGAPEVEIVGKTDYDFQTKEKADWFRDHDRKAMEADRPCVYEETITFASDGYVASLETIKTPMRNRDGRLVGILGIARDITTRKRAEERLGAALRQMYDIIEFLPDPTFVIDKDRKVVAWNKAMEELSGLEKGDIVGRGDYAYAIPFYGQRRPILIDLVYPSNEGMEKAYDYVKRVGSSIYAETFIQSMKGGAGVYLWGAAAPLLDSSGERIGAIEVIRDITERKVAEERLNAALGQMHDIIEFLPDPTFVIDKNRKIVAWNKALEDLTGVGKESMLGKGGEAYSLAIYGEPHPLLIDLLGLPAAELEAKYDQVQRSGEKVYADIFVPTVKQGRGAYL